MARNICERLIEARGDDSIVRIENIWAASPDEAARLFGLSESPETYHEISAQEARAVLLDVLGTDMAYHCEIVPVADAKGLADAFLDVFRHGPARYFTNGNYGQPRDKWGHGRTWCPATDATFDTGILVLDAGRVGCAWFMDED